MQIFVFLIRRLRFHPNGVTLKKLFVAAASICVFTLNGVSPVQLVAVIAFSAGVYSARFLPGTSKRTIGA